MKASEVEVRANALLVATFGVGNLPEIAQLAREVRHSLDTFEAVLPTQRIAALEGLASPRNTPVVDAHSEDYHVYIDGALRHVVPCGVCGTNEAGDPDHDERKRLFAAYGIKSPALRERVRQHMEDLLKHVHPASAVSVK